MIIKPDAAPPTTERFSDNSDHQTAISPDLSAAQRVVSGLYVARREEDDDDLSLEVHQPLDGSDPVRPASLASTVGREELRLDVDGFYSQRTASGVAVLGLDRVHWIAALAPLDE